MVSRESVFSCLATILIVGIVAFILFNSLVSYTSAHDKQIVTERVKTWGVVDQEAVYDITEVTAPDGTVTVKKIYKGTKPVYGYYYPATTKEVPVGPHKHWWERIVDACGAALVGAAVALVVND